MVTFALKALGTPTIIGRTKVLAVAGQHRFARVANLTGREAVALTRKMGGPAMAIALPILIAACAPGTDTSPSGYTPDSPAGFFSGIWHGIISPLTLVWPGCHIYEKNNTGFFYDLGFYATILSGWKLFDWGVLGKSREGLFKEGIIVGLRTALDVYRSQGRRGLTRIEQEGIEVRDNKIEPGELAPQELEDVD